MKPSSFSKQWGEGRRGIRNIGGRAYHYQGSWNHKVEAERAVAFYREEGRLARYFKRHSQEHVLKKSKEIRGHEVIVPARDMYDVYATVKIRKSRGE